MSDRLLLCCTNNNHNGMAWYFIALWQKPYIEPFNLVSLSPSRYTYFYITKFNQITRQNRCSVSRAAIGNDIVHVFIFLDFIFFDFKSIAMKTTSPDQSALLFFYCPFDWIHLFKLQCYLWYIPFSIRFCPVICSNALLLFQKKKKNIFRS